ncbi:BadF/BadG/BcrA/BcrD ATPase family protein [Microbacterium sp. EST19A]|uniref:N-acetylglucosamine kinase n=1 Tax=Microbacterium sp. EST19A TaxID=2862681 RepID=UPI001CBF0F05|nr:BadF/BadG/BcrA/BcrD ATPase family protein [Microbacterium sp. EST19A]
MTGTLAVDVGQSGCRLRLDDGDVIEAPLGVVALTGDEHVTALAQTVIDLVPPGTRPELVGVGLSGFVEDSPAPARLAERLRVHLGARTTVVAADAVTAFLGTVGARAGTVVICGTGVAALGVSDAGGLRRIDARGYLLGDFGGGAWIGQRGLQAALDALEGRGPATTLADASLRLGSPADIYHGAMGSTPAPQYIAAFAPDVIGAADEGDAAALGILADAADQLARTIGAARLGPGPIGLTGGLTRSSSFVSAVRTALDRRDVEVDEFVVQPDAGLDGARIVAEDTRIRSAFAGLIAVKE